MRELRSQAFLFPKHIFSNIFLFFLEAFSLVVLRFLLFFIEDVSINREKALHNKSPLSNSQRSTHPKNETLLSDSFSGCVWKGSVLAVMSFQKVSALL